MKFQFRRDTAANWTSNNPLLMVGEIGYETDTAKFKSGDGVNAWNSLGYNNQLAGYENNARIYSYGDGSDGDVNVSAGTTTLIRDMYYNNLTLSGSGQIATSGYRIFVKGTLDITASAANAIFFNGTNATNATTAAAGAAPAAPVTTSVGGGVAGTNGTAGSNNNAVAATNGAAAAAAFGGSGGNGGTGGNGATGTGAAGGTGGAITVAVSNHTWAIQFLMGTTVIQGGAGGGGGGGAGGNGATTGFGGGGGGSGAGIVSVYANIISRGASTNASTFSAVGGNGASQTGTPASGGGGGAGGGGGGGGGVVIYYATLTGTAKQCVIASGGNGGNGGNGAGAGLGGAGGSGGKGGRILLIQTYPFTVTEVIGPNGASGNAGSGTSGGSGGAGGTAVATL